MSAATSLVMYQVDAFTDRLFSGNPAAVLVLDDWLPDAMMLSIAQENNLAETAFLKAEFEGCWSLRWFTPAHEVDFCGHATLASAHVLCEHLGIGGRMTFRTRVGELHVEMVESGYRLDLPRFNPEPAGKFPPEIEALFHKPPVRIFRNFENLFADLGSSEAVRAFRPDLAAIAALGSVGLVVTGVEDASGRADFVSRYFAPGSGIPEDPVTGSIHATLVPYWAELLGRAQMLAYQASARGGWLQCELADDRVFLTGNAVTFMRAEVFLPDDGGANRG